MSNICIVIPVHKEDMDRYESISLSQCLNVFAGFSFSLTFPEGLNIDRYKQQFAAKQLDFKPEPFDPAHFRSVDDYNLLMLRPGFYDRFLGYDYILIYQLDSFVFRNELTKWCNFGYDYVGAPWAYLQNGKLRFKGVGNGGFSLRNPARLKEFLLSDSIRMNFRGFWKLYSAHNLITRLAQLPKIAIRLMGYHNRKSWFFNQVDVNEDYVFGLISQYSNHKLEVPPVKLAMQFAFDQCPKALFEMNNQELPFGCHGWSQSEENLEFWKQYIDNKG